MDLGNRRMDFGSRPVGTPSSVRAVTLPLALRLADFPRGSAIGYEGGDPTLTALLRSEGIGVNPTVGQLIGAYGDATLSFELADLSLDGDEDDFSLDPGACLGEPNGTCIGRVRFLPGAVGRRTAALRATIDHLAVDGPRYSGALGEALAPVLAAFIADGPLRLDLSGVGVSPLAVSPAALTFERRPVGVSGVPARVELRNRGSGSIVVTDLKLVGAHPGDFTLESDAHPWLEVQPNESATLAVRFRPTARGERAAELQIVSDAAGSPAVVALSGTGIAPIVSLDTTRLSFGSAPAGSITAPQVVVVANTGDGPLRLAAIEIERGDRRAFTVIEENCTGRAIPPGGRGTIVVSFRPSEPGPATAALRLTDNAVDSPRRVTLRGTGTPAADLAVSLTAGRPSVKMGDELSYIARVVNNGPGPAVDVLLSLELAPGATFAEAVEPCQAPPIGANGVVSRRIGVLPRAAAEQLTVTVRVVAPSRTELVSGASASAGTLDPDMVNNVARILTPIVS